MTRILGFLVLLSSLAVAQEASHSGSDKNCTLVEPCAQNIAKGAVDHNRYVKSRKGRELILKANAFLGKKKACDLAIGALFLLDSGVTLSMRVFCFGDMVRHEGGINETKGCGLMGYDMESATYIEPYQRPYGLYDEPFVPEVACLKGGFESLIVKVADPATCLGTVGRCPLSVWGGGDVIMPVLLYSNHQKYESFFEDSIVRKNKDHQFSIEDRFKKIDPSK